MLSVVNMRETDEEDDAEEEEADERLEPATEINILFLRTEKKVG